MFSKSHYHKPLFWVYRKVEDKKDSNNIIYY